ncbi:15195_t:CDS:2, partial [Funneliformis mosseae]
MSTEKKITSWSAYFDVTSPEKYSFLGYYEYRSKQEDFISFRKECHRLKTDLANLMKNSSGEMKEVASRLEKSRKYCMLGCNNASCRKESTQLRVTLSRCPPYRLRACCGHRKYYKDVDMFWNQIERRQAEAEASSSVIRDTTEAFKNSIASVNSSIMNVNNTMIKYNEELKGDK